MTRRILPAGVILLLFLSASYFGCAHEPNIGDIIYSKPKVKSKVSGRIEIPFNYDFGIPYITAEIEGIGPCRFAYDTGTSRSALTDKMIEELGLKPKAVQKARRNEERISAEAYVLPPLRFGDFEMEGITAYKHEDFDIEWLHSQRDAGGILSWTVFNDYVVTVDYGRQRLILKAPFPPNEAYRQESLLFEYGDYVRKSLSAKVHTTIVTNESYSIDDAEGSSSIYLPFIWRYTWPTLPLRVKGIERVLLFMIDTGSARNRLRSDLIDTENRPDAVPVKGMLNTFEGTKVLDTQSVLSVMYIGLPVQITTMECLTLDDHQRYVKCSWYNKVDGILGTDFLKNYAVTIDRRNRMVVLRPLKGGGEGEETDQAGGPSDTVE